MTNLTFFQKAPTPQTSDLCFPNTWPLLSQKKLKNSVGHFFLLGILNGEVWHSCVQMNTLLCNFLKRGLEQYNKNVRDVSRWIHSSVWILLQKVLSLSQKTKVFVFHEQVRRMWMWNVTMLANWYYWWLMIVIDNLIDRKQVTLYLSVYNNRVL